MKIRFAAVAVVFLMGTSLAVAESGKANTPFQYIDMPIKEVANRVGVQPNQANNIVFDSADRHVLLESNGSTIDYVDVEFTNTPPCNPQNEIEAEAVLKSLGLNPAEMELAIKQPGNHTYYDHKRMLKVGVSCSYEGAPLTAAFSRKNYMNLTSSTKP